MTSRLHHPTVWLRRIFSNTKGLLALVAGTSILGAGLAMLVLPDPGTLVILAGLAVLATEFAWAERTLDRTTTRAAKATTALTATRDRPSGLRPHRWQSHLGRRNRGRPRRRVPTGRIAALSAGIGALAVVVSPLGAG